MISESIFVCSDDGQGDRGRQMGIIDCDVCRWQCREHVGGHLERWKGMKVNEGDPSGHKEVKKVQDFCLG